MVGFLKARSLGDHGGLAAYREDESPTSSMTAEAFFCKQMLGMRRDNAALAGGCRIPPRPAPQAVTVQRVLLVLRHASPCTNTAARAGRRGTRPSARFLISEQHTAR